MRTLITVAISGLRAAGRSCRDGEYKHVFGPD